MCKQGAYRGYLNCNIRGTNNQLPNIFYKLVHLNIKYKIVHLQVVWRQIFVFRKLYLSQTEENKYLWTYGCASLVSDFKPTPENDDLLSSRQMNFWGTAHCARAYNMWIPDKRYRTNTVRIYWGTRSTWPLRYHGLAYFGRFDTKFCEIQVRL